MWNKIFFNAQSIQGETDRSVLIKMPNRSQYNGWCFWHPKNLVREQGGRSYFYSFSFTDEWEFHVKLYGRGKQNWKDIISEVTLDVNEMKTCFNVVDESVNDSVEMETKKIIEKETVYIEVEHHVPERINLTENNDIEDLKK